MMCDELTLLYTYRPSGALSKTEEDSTIDLWVFNCVNPLTTEYCDSREGQICLRTTKISPTGVLPHLYNL